MPYKFNPLTGKMDYFESGELTIDIVTPEAYRLSGKYYTSVHQAGSITTAALTLNVLHAMPFLVPVQQNFDRIACYVTSGGAGGKARLGVYSDDDIYPNVLQLSSSELDISSIGRKEEVINLTLNPGLYWLVLLSDSGAQFRAANNPDVYAILGWPDTLTGNGYYFYYKNHAYGTLPDPFPDGAFQKNDAAIPLVWLRKA